MGRESNKAMSASLQALSEQFENWRAKKSTMRQRIPNHLWQQASELLNDHSLEEIKKTLKLSTSQIKAKFQKSLDKSSISLKPSPSFISVNIPQKSEEMNINFVGKVEIKRTDGAVISIDGLNQKILAQLLTQFMEVL